jgi:hypothetical protein
MGRVDIPIEITRTATGEFAFLGDLDEPAAECDDGFIGTEMIEVTAPSEEGAKRALTIKAKAGDKKKKAEFKCDAEFCESGNCVFRAGWAGPPTFERQPDITLDDDGPHPQVIKGQVVGKRRRHFGCFCRVLV